MRHLRRPLLQLRRRRNTTILLTIVNRRPRPYVLWKENNRRRPLGTILKYAKLMKRRTLRLTPHRQRRPLTLTLNSGRISIGVTVNGAMFMLFVLNNGRPPTTGTNGHNNRRCRKESGRPGTRRRHRHRRRNSRGSNCFSYQLSLFSSLLGGHVRGIVSS